MDFTAKLQNYARLLVGHGLNVQPGQVVQITAEPIHRELVLRIAELAYERGARYVHLALVEPEAERIRIAKGDVDDLEFVPPFVVAKYDFLLDQHAANLRIIGERNPDILSDLPADRVNALKLAQRQAMRRFYEEGIGKSSVHWCVAGAATPGWAQKVFPQLAEKEAYDRLWEQIFRICRADQSDCLELWAAHDERLKRRAKTLNELQIGTLHFRGPGTDLKVGLCSEARFVGGSDKGPHGAAFEPNIPTEEVFTTPDWRLTDGAVRTTRPFVINGVLIKDLELIFREGRIVDFSASQGYDTFAAYIESDQGAARLGEVALVGIDSPVYRSGLVFEEILYDENAACHIAVGLAYKFCLNNGENMSKQELDSHGCNESSVHTDMMISSEEVDVVAETRQGETRTLIRAGEWAI